MDKVFEVDWQAMFLPSIGLAEIVLRGLLVYLALFVMLRFLGNRQSGRIGPADLLVLVLIADAAQNALGAEYRSVTEGVTLVMTIIACDFAIDWLQYHVPALRPWLGPRPLRLIVNGRMDRKNMRAEMISHEELMSQLREHGIERLEQVKIAHLEPDGRLSVIKKSS